jgi:hypothetical protein
MSGVEQNAEAQFLHAHLPPGRLSWTSRCGASWSLGEAPLKSATDLPDEQRRENHVKRSSKKYFCFSE